MGKLKQDFQASKEMLKPHVGALFRMALPQTLRSGRKGVHALIPHCPPACRSQRFPAGAGHPSYHSNQCVKAEIIAIPNRICQYFFLHGDLPV